MVESERRVENLFAKRTEPYGGEGGWTIGIEGAAAEMCFAKMTDRYWSGSVGDLKAKDVGNIQVRSTSHPKGRLLLHPRDKDDDIFVLLVGTAPTFEYRGWLRARDGKLQEYLDEPQKGRRAFCVPQERLNT